MTSIPFRALFRFIAQYFHTRTLEFNAILQKIWDEYAQFPAVWQGDPDNDNKPLLLLYVGTDGPAIYRDVDKGSLERAKPFGSTVPNYPLTWKITRDGVATPIDQVFSIKYVAANMASEPLMPGNAWDAIYREDQAREPAQRVGVRPLRDRVSRTWTANRQNAPTRRYYDSHWTFRENADYLTTAPVGTLNATRTAVEAIHVAGYRANGPAALRGQLHVAIEERPRFLILTAWNEFGSASDEPSPDASWTLMPNNKYGRYYSEVLHEKIKEFKEAP